MSNIVPGAIGEMVKAIQNWKILKKKANRMKDILDPLFQGGDRQYR